MTFATLTRCVAIIAAVAALATSASAQNYPNRNVRIVVAHAAGSSPDILARVVANQLTKRLNQTFIVENRTGANGSLAAEQVSRTDPDGYTLLLAGSSIISTNPFLYPRASATIIDGLTPLSNLAGLDFWLAARSSLEAKTLPDVVKAIKANPGKLNLATTNIGSYQYLGAAMLKQQGGLDFTTVPYNGGAAAGTALAGGHADLLIEAGAIVQPLVQSGRATLLASTGSTRDPSTPNVPTVAESGFPGYRVFGWVGMMAPANTPPAVLNVLHGAIAASMKEEDVQGQLKKMGMAPIGNSPADFTKELIAERAQWKRVIDGLGLKLEQ